MSPKKACFLFLPANDQVEDILVKPQILHSLSRSYPSLKPWQNKTYRKADNDGCLNEGLSPQQLVHVHKHILLLIALVSGGALGAASQMQVKNLLTLPAQAAAPQDTEAAKHLGLPLCAFNALIFCQFSALKRFAKMAELKVWQGRWLRAGGDRKRKQQLCFLAEVWYCIVKMEIPGKLRITNGEF